MLEGSTQRRSAPVFLALSLLSAVFALDLSGSSGVGVLSAHTLMAASVRERKREIWDCAATGKWGPKLVLWVCPFHLLSHATMVYSPPSFLLHMHLNVHICCTPRVFVTGVWDMGAFVHSCIKFLLTSPPHLHRSWSNLLMPNSPPPISKNNYRFS